MNHIHRLVWSARRGAYVAVAESARRGGRRSGVAGALVAAALLGASGLAHAQAQSVAPPPVHALPKGGQVVAGQAQLKTAGSTLTVDQASQRAVINWQSFNIGSGARVDFVQPNASSVALNRVLGSDPSAIFGQLTATGQVFLVNPNGVLFGAGARVDVGGLVATTMSLSDSDFLAGQYHFTDGAGQVRNEGSLTARDGGYIALLAPEVRNDGVVSATLGTVALEAGRAVTLQTDGVFSVAVDQGALDALVDNGHLVKADGGRVFMSAVSSGALQSAVIRNDGVIEARGARDVGGVIRLEADSVSSTGTLDVSSSGGAGGQVDVRAQAGGNGSLSISGSVLATGTQGGRVVLTGDTVRLVGATVDASGTNGGGTIAVGGGRHGADASVADAQDTSVDAASQLRADALRSGNGGQVTVWSDQHTAVNGQITARGGAAGGDGGFVETSGKATLDLAGASVDASARKGADGQWLLDPSDITIDHSSSGALSAGTFNPGSSSTIGDGQINAALNGGTDVTIETRAGSGGSGNITVNANVAISNTSGGARTLNLTADGTLTTTAGSTIAGSSGNPLNVNLSAGVSNAIYGVIDNAGGTTTFAGPMTTASTTWFKNGTLTGLDASPVIAAHDVTLQSETIGSSLTLTSGTTWVWYDLTLANGVTLTSAGGDWNFNELNTGQSSGSVDHIQTSGTATFNLQGGTLYLYAQASQFVDVGAGVTFEGYGRVADTFGPVNTFSNHGTILAGTNGQTLNIQSAHFANASQASASNGGTLALNSAVGWTNTGTLTANAGSTLDLGGKFTTAQVATAGSVVNNGGSVNLTGTLDNTSATVDLGADFGTGGLTTLNYGTILGGTVTDTLTGHTLDVSGQGWLNGVTIGGTVTTSGNALYVYNDLGLANGATLNVGADMQFDGQATNQAAGTVHHITTTGAGTIDDQGHDIYMYSQNGQTLDIGAGVTVQGWGSLREYFGGNTLTNHGSIVASGTANQVLAINTSYFANAGQVTADTGTLALGGQWTNTGTLIANTGGTLNLGGSFTTAQVDGLITNNGGAVNLTGTMDNTGATADVGTAGSFGSGGLTIAYGTISGGTVMSSDATPVLHSSGQAWLDGVTISGNLALAGDGLYTHTDLTLAAGATLTLGADLLFDGTTTNTAAGVVHHLNGSGTVIDQGQEIYINSQAGQTLEIASGITIEGWGNLREYYGGNTIINHGTIASTEANETFNIFPSTLVSDGQLTASAGTLQIQYASWTNTGAITVDTGATLNLGGQFTTAQVANHVTRQAASTLNVTGILDNTGTTLDIGSSGIFGTGGLTALGGTIRGGTVTDTDPNHVLSTPGADFDGVTLAGTISLTGGDVMVQHDLTLADGATLNLVGSGLQFDGQSTSDVAGTVHYLQTPGHATINDSGQEIIPYASNGQTLDIGAGITIQGYGFLQKFWNFGLGDIVNHGTILANDANGNTFYISPINFTNDGTLSASGLGTLQVSSGGFTQAGQVTVDGGTVLLGGNWTNSGTITVNSGTLQIGGTVAASQLAGSHFVRNGGDVDITGTLDNTSNTLDIGGAGLFGSGGLTQLSGIIAGGTLADSDANAVLASSGGALDGVTIADSLHTTGNLYIRHGVTLADGITVGIAANAGNWIFDGQSTGEAAGTVQHLATSGHATFDLGYSTSLYIYSNNGQTLQIDSGITVQSDGGALNQSGSNNSVVNAGTLVLSGGDTYINVGQFTNAGTLDVNAGARALVFTPLVNSGTLMGSGTVNVGTGVNGLINSGTIAPGEANATGTLTVSGDVQLASGSVLSERLGGTGAGQSDKLVVTGAVSGDTGAPGSSFGTLNVSRINGYWFTNASGDDYALLSAGSGGDSGSFSNSVSLVRATSTPAYAPTGVALNVVPDALTITPDALTKVYGQADPTFTYTATGFDTGDNASNSLSGALGRAAGKDVGSYAYAAGTLASTDGYAIVLATGNTFQVTPASITLTASNASKAYDGGLAATSTAVVASGTLLAGDSLSGGTFAFTDPNAGAGNKTVTTTGVTVGDGTHTNDYTVSYVDNTTSTITPRVVSLTGSRVYDGSLSVDAGALTLGNLVGGQTLALSGSATLLTKDVATGKPASDGTLALASGTGLASNYTLVGGSIAVDVTRASLVVTGVSAVGKVYDTTLAATLTGSASVSAIGSDVVSVIGTGSGSFATKDVGNGKAVTVTGYTLTGNDAGDYTIVEPVGVTANITPASLTVTGVSAASKVYDATLAATLTGSASVSAIGSDVVSVIGTGSGSFATKDVGNGKAVTVTGYTLTGNDAGNYTLVEPVGVTANITPALLAVTGVSAAGKVYDATLAATLNGTATVTGIGSDVVSVIGTGSGSFATKDVGSGKAVTVTGYTLTGNDTGNYTLVEPAGLTANITPALLAVTGVSAASKVYDATLAATLTGSASVSAIGSDVVSVIGTGSGSFATKDVGSGKAVTVTGYTLTGNDAGDYTLVEPAGLTANITPASLVVTGVSAASKVYDTTNAATLTGSAVVAALGSDQVALAGTGVGAFADKNAGIGKAVAVTGYVLTGNDASNYAIVEPTGVTANVTPASLAVTGVSAASKIYDATLAATLTGTAAVTALGADQVAVGGAGAGTFANKNVGAGKAVTVTGYVLTGPDAGNYAIVQPVGVTASITPASLTVTGVTAASKAYDGSTAATLVGTPTVVALANDAVSVSGSGVGTFADKAIGTGKAVTVAGYALAGADAGNYVAVQPVGLTADITGPATSAPFIPAPAVTPPSTKPAPPATLALPPAAQAAPTLTLPAPTATAATPAAPAAAPSETSAAPAATPAEGGLSLTVPTSQGANFAIALPAGVLSQEGGAVSLVGARTEAGDDLPPWLKFAPQTQSFSGVVPAGVQTMKVRIVGRDAGGHESSVVVELHFVDGAVSR